MRSLLVAIAAIAITAGCGSPAPTGAPVALASGDTPSPSPIVSVPSPTLQVAETPQASPSMAAFDTSYPEKGWVVASADDATGNPEHVITYGRAEAGALLDLAYTCEQGTKISVRAIDGRSSAGGDVVLLLEATCRPGEIGRATAPSISATMPISLEVTVDPAVRFWAKLGVPSDHFLR